MMNDRFAAGLRQHLLDTADERPADGQLAAITALVADAPQRPPLVARLASFPLRIRPFPSPAIRWAILAAALLSVALGAALLGGGGPTRSTVFEGTWTAPDSADGSIQTFVVAAGTSPAVHYEDDLSTGGACAADPVKLFTAIGTGRVSGSLLAVSYPDGGGCGLNSVEMGPGVLEYDAATDTLSDALGQTWIRTRDLGLEPLIISSLMVDAPSGANAGTFETSGAARERGLVCPNGTVTDLVEVDSGAIGRGELEDFTIPKEFACEDGSGTFAASVAIHVDLEAGTESFSWVITGGTGPYAGLHGQGHGSTQGQASDTFLNTYWGFVARDQGLPPEIAEPSGVPSIEPSPITGCLGIPGGEYGFDVDGVVPLVTFPSPWHAVDNGFHHLQNSVCGSSGSMGIDIGRVTEVYADSCHSTGSGVALGEPATTTAFSALGFETTRSAETTVAGFPAARFDFSVPADFDLSACDGETLRLWGEGPAVDPGLVVTVLLFQVDDRPIGVAATRNADASQAEIEELDEILTSLRIES